MSTPPLDQLRTACLAPAGPVVIEAASLSSEEASQLSASLAAQNIQARVIDGARLSGKDSLMKELARAFNFPSHQGSNWDALIDSWSDMNWLPAHGYVCILINADALKTADAATHEMFLEVCGDVAERWRQHNPPVVFKLVRGARA